MKVWQATYCFSYGGHRVIFVEALNSASAWEISKKLLTAKEQRSISRSSLQEVEEG